MHFKPPVKFKTWDVKAESLIAFVTKGTWGLNNEVSKVKVRVCWDGKQQWNKTKIRKLSRNILLGHQVWSAKVYKWCYIFSKLIANVKMLIFSSNLKFNRLFKVKFCASNLCIQKASMAFQSVLAETIKFKHFKIKTRKALCSETANSTHLLLILEYA